MNCSRLLPLVIDLDGTLLRSDLLLETGMSFVRHQPWQLYRLPLWLQRGKAALKGELARRTQIDVRLLPYEESVLQLIREARAQGRPTVLATASHHMLAERIAEHLGLFDQVLATDEHCNLSAERKRDQLVSRYGERGFDYAGNAMDDLSVWASARHAYVVNPEPGVERRARTLGNLHRTIRSAAPGAHTWARALRLHQWLKNVLIFVPLLAAHQLGNPVALLQVLLGFLLFGLCASSVYLLNDLLDLDDDRHHPSKRHRPLASGQIPVRTALLLCPALLGTAFAGAWLWLPWQFTALLAGYYLLTLAYSLLLKRMMAADVITLASLYTLRIIAGAAAAGLPLTFWILAFSMFIFLSLALMKRHTELEDSRRRGLTDQMRGRGYYPDDLEMVAAQGAAAGYLSVMILALYIHDQGTASLYTHPHVIWLACPLLLFWITRVWMLTHRGQMHDDPIVFALKDRCSQLVGILFGLVFWIAA